MGRGHVLSGAATWMAGCAALAALGRPVSLSIALVGTGVAAGCAVLPDVDHPGSTIARTLGPAGRALARAVGWAAARVRMSSCRHCAGPTPRGGHRTLTHTALFAVVLGGLVAVSAAAMGATSGLATVAVGYGLAARVLLSRRQRGTLGAAILGVLAAAAVGVTAGPGYGWWWLGVPVAWGCLAHCVGDALTVSGCPLLWPLRVRGCRWRSVGTPRLLRFRTGGWVEGAVRAMLGVVLAVSGWVVLVGWGG